MTREVRPIDRLYFLDNLRLLAVLAVVALHAAIAYAPIVPWWYVTDQSKNDLLNLLLVVTDGFVMPTLFFIAGYFALPSLRRHGAVGFLVARLRRLGLPLVVLTVFFCPIISYVVFLGQGGNEAYLGYWLRVLPTGLHWSFHVLTAESSSRLHGYLWSFHLWFLAMLLVFCGLLSLGYAVFARKEGGTRTRGRGAGFALFAFLALAVGFAEAGGQAVVADSIWASFGPIFEFQPARLPLYLGIFLLGAYAWDREWFTRNRLPGRLWQWGLPVAAAYLAMMVTGMANMAPGPKSVWIPVAHGFFRTLVALAVTGFLAVFGQRYWNRPGGVSASLAASSYDIYLAHMPLVVVLQYLLAGVLLPALVKFGIIFAASTLICWGASRFSESRRRLWVPTGTLAAFGLCVLVWG